MSNETQVSPLEPQEASDIVLRDGVVLEAPSPTLVARWAQTWAEQFRVAAMRDVDTLNADHGAEQFNILTPAR